ncbi:MAG: GntR family transcriptional regulator [Noviherbaspirillum sp.]
MPYMQDVRSPAEVAYDRIKQAILNVTYRPGEKLSEVRLAGDLQLGRSPIRSALARLEAENWIRVFPQSGTFVRTLEIRELEELSELRLILECHATRSATARISDAELVELRNMFEQLKTKRIEDHISEFKALDTQFHSTIYRVAGNRRIEDILLNLKDQIVWVRAVTATLPGRVSQSLREMDDVLGAMERRDAEAAVAAMAAHIGNIADTFKSMPAAAAKMK